MKKVLNLKKAKQKKLDKLTEKVITDVAYMIHEYIEAKTALIIGTVLFIEYAENEEYVENEESIILMVAEHCLTKIITNIDVDTIGTIEFITSMDLKVTEIITDIMTHFNDFIINSK